MVNHLPVVKVNKLGLAIVGQTILKDISFVVERHEKIVICGPSGSGKTTLLRCLNGLSEFNSGSIVVHGVRLQDADSIKLVRRKTGMLFQGFNLFPHLTVVQNCMLALTKVKAMSQDKALSSALHYLDKVKIADHADKYPVMLSGGQQQRAAIARALCLEPELMLFDEPTSALDPEMIGEVLEVMNDLSDLGITIICVTHEMQFARHFANRMLFVDAGDLLLDAPVNAFFESCEQPRVRAFLDKLACR